MDERNERLEMTGNKGRRIKALKLPWLALLLLLPIAASADGCNGLFADGMETPRYPAVEPSGGCGGGIGSSSRSVFVSGLGSQTYYVHVPASYDPMQPVPWLLAWPGAGGPGTAHAAAMAARDHWAPVADDEGFIVVAQVATGSSGGWIPKQAVAIRDAIRADVAAAWNVDLARLFGWGFSAGGHVLHAVALAQSDLYAAYGVNAGVLAAYAGTQAPAQTTRQIPVVITVGTFDSLYRYALADRQTFMLNGWSAGETLFFEEPRQQHVYTEADLRRYWQLLGQSVRP